MQNEDDISRQLFSVRDYIRYAMSRFTQSGVYYGHGTDNAWDEAVELIFFLLNMPLDADQRVLDARLTAEERKLIIRMIENRCIDRIPLPYITGRSYFAGLEFKIDERALIPRSPIAELVESGFAPWLMTQPERVLDLCCGSGCIGIAVSAIADSSVVLADISEEALKLAKQNVDLHDLEDKVVTVESDLFEKIEGTFDLIVSNPPYVDAEDLESMPAEYAHEPRLALEAGADGLALARQILENAKHYLNDQGLLIMELGNSWIHLEEAYPSVPWTWVEFERGGHGVLAISRAELEQYF